MTKTDLKFGSLHSQCNITTTTTSSSSGTEEKSSSQTNIHHSRKSSGGSKPLSINNLPNVHKFGDIDARITTRHPRSKLERRRGNNMSYNNNRGKHHVHHPSNQFNPNQPPPPQQQPPQMPMSGQYPQQYQFVYPNPYYYTPQMVPTPNMYGMPPTSPYSPSARPVDMNQTSPVQQRAQSKPHTPIKLSDPITKQPIDLGARKINGGQSASSTPSSTKATIATPASPSPNTQSLNASSASISSPGHKSTGSVSEDVKKQFQEKIREKLEAEKREKEEAERKRREEEEKRLAEEKRIKEEEEAAARAKAEAEAKAKAEEEARIKAEAEAEAAAKQAEAEKAAAAEAAEAAAKQAEVDKAAATAADAADAAAKAEAEAEAEAAKANAVAEPEEEIASPAEDAAKSAADKALESTKVLLKALEYRPTTEEVNAIKYPENVPRPADKSDNGFYRYDLRFLASFQPIVRFPPVENWAEVSQVIPVSANRSEGGKSGFGGKGGYSRSSSTRNANAHGSGSMGNFGSGSNFRNMERSASSSVGGMGGFGGMGGGKLGRVHSQSNLNSMNKGGRQGSARRRGGERSGSSRNKEDKEKPEAPFVPPPPRSANAWVPRVKKKDEPAPGEISDTNRLEPEVVQRKVKSLLNKMTLEKFDKISQQILEIAAQSKFEKDGRTLRQVLELTFAKATDEPHWSSMYARFCALMMSSVDDNIEDDSIKDKDGNPVRGGALFRKYLLSRCQEEFERGWTDQMPINEDGSKMEAELMSDEYYAAVAAKRRGLGLIRFIGELFLLKLLSDRIIHTCINKLLSANDTSEATIESLCKLMTTVGALIDVKHKELVDIYFVKMDKIMKQETLPSRLRFMLMDVADLRRRNWISKNADKAPKTITEIQQEAKQKQIADEAARQQSRRNFRGGERSSSSLNLAGDLSRWGRIRQQSGGQTMGPTSTLNRDLSGSGSGRRNASSSSSMASTPSAAGTPLSKEPSRGSASQGGRANIFEHLNGDDEEEPASNDHKAGGDDDKE
ncbi:eukaryotic initiation factor 4F subunit p150 [Trichomonascus vanleenenianus]|uniref:eukaryotic initiation factor 4F subunit p150 n=1 Tax=Trichomonascus vanleenenianus TaxID=2268995 RepID=UPI003ECA78C1